MVGILVFFWGRPSFRCELLVSGRVFIIPSKKNETGFYPLGWDRVQPIYDPIISDAGRAFFPWRTNFSLAVFHTSWCSWWLKCLHPRKLTCPLTRDYFNRKCIFQPSFFRGYVSFQGGVHPRKLTWNPKMMIWKMCFPFPMGDFLVPC